MYVYNSKVTKHKKKNKEMNIAITSHSYHENRLHFDYIQKGEQSKPTSTACLAFLGLHFHQYNGMGN